MTSMPEAASPPGAWVLASPSKTLRGRFSAAADAAAAVTSRIRSFPSRRPFFPALLYSMARRTGTSSYSPFSPLPLFLSLFSRSSLSLSFSLSLTRPSILFCGLFFSAVTLSHSPASPVCLVALTPGCHPSSPPVHPFLLSWDLARERLSSYIEKSGGRLKNWRYLYHLLCFAKPLARLDPFLRKKPCI